MIYPDTNIESILLKQGIKKPSLSDFNLTQFDIDKNIRKIKYKNKILFYLFAISYIVTVFYIIIHNQGLNIFSIFTGIGLVLSCSFIVVPIGMVISEIIEFFIENKNVTNYNKKIKEYLVSNKDEADIIFTTTHKAKGMEYNQVIMTDDFITKKDILNRKKSLSFTSICEELNIYYVAASRAKFSISLADLKLDYKEEKD